MSVQNRRPLTSRNSAWAARLASWAVQKGLTPNQISQASMAFAATGFALYWLTTQGPGFVQFLCLLLAASLAIATAYIRELGRAEGFPPDFSGPLAKPQRMAVLTAGTVLAALYASHWTLTITLWIIVAGTAITVLRRSSTVINKLKSK